MPGVTEQEIAQAKQMNLYQSLYRYLLKFKTLNVT